MAEGLALVVIWNQAGRREIKRTDRSASNWDGSGVCLHRPRGRVEIRVGTQRELTYTCTRLTFS